MPRRLPASYKAGKAIVLSGTSYATGATIPNAVVARLRNASSLLSNGSILANADPHWRKGKATTRRPSTLNYAERRKLISG